MDAKLEKYSTAKLYLTLFALGVTGGAVYIAPYIRTVFYDLHIGLLGVTNAQYALLATTYSFTSMCTTVPGGMLCDKLKPRTSMMIANIGMTLASILLVFCSTSYIMTIGVWVVFAFFSMTVYWPAFSKILNTIGRKTGKGGSSGSAFGIYYAVNGISAAIINALALWASTFFEGKAQLDAALYVAAGFTIVAAALIWFLFDPELTAPVETAKEEGPKVKEKTTIGEFVSVLKNPRLYAVCVLCVGGGVMYNAMTYFTPFLTAVSGVTPATSGVFGIIRTYVFLLLAPIGGFIADRVFKSSTKWLIVGYALIAASVLGIFLIPEGANPMMIGFYTLLPAAVNQLTYTIRYSSIGELAVPSTQLGTITGFVSSTASITNLCLNPTFGHWIDVYGVGGYYRMFIAVGIVMIIASLAGVYIVIDKKRAMAREAKNA